MMKRKNSILLPAGILLGMLCLILDSACASESAGQAISLCTKTVIPSLFPMFVLSGLMVSACSSGGGMLLRVIESTARLPRGTGILFLLGLVGGFPVGAQCITQSVKENDLSRKDAERMLGFCNNCGPAFLFGITGMLFSSPEVPWALFLIQAECALLAAAIFSAEPERSVEVSSHQVTVSGAVQQAVRSITTVCAWVILASVFTGFLERWFFPMLPELSPCIIRGIIELTSGALGLQAVSGEPLRMILCSGMINFGGLCVILQIQSLAAGAGLSVRYCIAQKLVQGLLGCLMSLAYLKLGWIGLLVPVPALFFAKKKWKNTEEPCIIAPIREGSNHAVP